MNWTFLLVALVALVPSAVFGQNCYTCQDAAAGGACSTLTDQTPTPCPGANLGCFREELADGRVNRGCASALGDSELAACTTGTAGCKICQGDLCNAKLDFQRCHRCDTVAQNCPQPQAAADNTYLCSAYLDTCGVQIVGSQTLRGCVLEMTFPETCNALTCTACEANFCNQGVFPVQRQQCHTCTSALESCFEQQTGARRVCDNYVATNDQCYYALDGNRQVFRGCMSDANAGVTACNAGNCVKCFAAGCNSDAVRGTPQLSCIQCGTTNPLCAWGYLPSDATSCTNTVYMGQTETCMQRAMANGGAQRSCSLDVIGNCSPQDESCITCTGNGCNRITYNTHNCYQCSGDGCKDPLEAGFEITPCPGNFQQLADKGCYVLEQENGNVVRGCTRGLDSTILGACQSEEWCELCDEDGCNKQPFGAAGALRALSVAVVAAIAVGVHMF